MDAHTLQNILRSKYNLNEKLQAEGICVVLQGGTMKANGLFSIGIGERFVVVAGVNPRGPDIDYNPVSFTPVGMLSVTYKNASMIVTISSQLKGENSFQLCSSSKAAAIWKDFITAIDYQASKLSGDIWCSASLSVSSSSSSSDASVNAKHEDTYQRGFIGRTLLKDRCLSPQRFPMADRSVYFRYTMDAYTLQNIRRSKYNINEKLQAEGVCVALQGGPLKANGLFSIGIGERFVVVAGINPRGPDIDYNPVSFTPVGMLSVTYKNASTMVTISSPLKGQNSFQLRSSSKAAAIWNDFITAIDNQSSKLSGDIWCSALLSASSSSLDASVNVRHEHTYQRTFIGRTLLKDRCLTPQKFPPADRSVYFTYTMGAHTLQKILRSKYNLNEKLQAKCVFVALQGGTMKANGLFSIGTGERFVVVAGINPHGPDIDYNPVSFTPVVMLGVTYKNASTIVTISIPLKGKNSFQLCSSSKAAAIWKDFTTAIDYQASKLLGDICCSASLSVSSSSSDASVNVKHEDTYQRDFIGRTLLKGRCLSPQRFPTADRSFSSISLPDMVCGPTDAKHVACLQHVKRGHSLDCVNVSLDSFINDNDTNRNAAMKQVDFTATDTVIGKNYGQLTDERRTDMSSKQPSLLERFLRLFTCCVSKH
ncbi:uncharacterized protein LOC127880048 [Dreissena polymorpha]|uniref:Uncharacterized protein n=1 Tax=Dreissena polymorpha TaxID=45954 RepID=A0A9D4KKS4_DREPO|nr:uncharacterized protein LOC127880048 [Dreissena polymorpha]KAH3841688.1 hypothetical protein DPMN_115161 [Dreissena polymorpha]